MAAILDFRLNKISPIFIERRKSLFFDKYLKLPKTLLAEGWSRNHGFGSDYMTL